MGNQSSKSTQLNDILNKVATEITVSVASRGSGSYIGDQNVTISGNAGDINGVKIEQVGSIDLSIAQNADVNADLQERLTTGLSNAIEQARSDFPQINASSTTSEIKNIVRNEVKAKFGVESLASLQLDIKQNQNIDIDENGGDVKNVEITQTAKGVGRLVNSLSSSITKQILTDTSADNDSNQRVDFWGAELMASFGTMIGNIFGGIFGPMTPLLIVAICAGGLLMLYVMYKFFASGGTAQDTMMMVHPMAGMMSMAGQMGQQAISRFGGPPQYGQQFGPAPPPQGPAPPPQYRTPPPLQYGPYGPPPQQYGQQGPPPPQQYGQQGPPPPQPYRAPPPLQYPQ
jgi:hypothetical protein